MPGEHVLWRDVADGTVQMGVVVMREIRHNNDGGLLHSTGVEERNKNSASTEFLCLFYFAYKSSMNGYPVRLCSAPC